MEQNRFFVLYDNNEVDENLLKMSVSGWSFEDHYWHFACLALYYKNTNQKHLEKECLSKMCDMNYVYNALSYYNTLGILPTNYKKYIIKFTSPMVNDKVDKQIEEVNKDSRRKQRRKYWLSSLTTLLTIPLMLFLMLVCKLDNTTSIIISIVFLFLMQTITSPLMANTRLRKYLKSIFERNKKTENHLSKEVNEYFKYLDRFVRIVNNEYYLAIAREKDEVKIQELVKIIKEKKINV